MYAVNQTIQINNVNYSVLGQSTINPNSNHAKYVSGYVYLKAENGRVIFRVLVDRNGKLGNRVQSMEMPVSFGIEKFVEMDANMGR